MASIREKILRIGRLVGETKKDCVALQRKGDLTEQGRGQLTLALRIEKILTE